MRYVVPSITLSPIGDGEFRINRVINSMDYTVGGVFSREELQALIDSQAINVFLKADTPTTEDI